MGGSVLDNGLEGLDPHKLREIIRRGGYDGHTAGLAPGFAQGNVYILPRDIAGDFAAFCKANPKPCPLIGVSAPGDPHLPALGDFDIRTDVPRYRVFRNGERIDEPSDILSYWSDDLVTFVLGCSFSFEDAMLRDGLPVQHIARNKTVPMYRTSIACTGAGPFQGSMVVSMRPLHADQIAQAIRISTQFPAAHGAPVHVGAPQEIGIGDLGAPDFGDPPQMSDDLIPVFWACGVTPQVAIERAKPRLCITHKPGAMLITDRPILDIVPFDVAQAPPS